MILSKISVREIRSHWGRAVLTVLSIVIGVAAVVAVNLASDAVRLSFGAVQSTIAGQAALEVRAAGEGLIDQDLVEVVADTPGVAAATPAFEHAAAMYLEDRRVRVILLGVDPERADLAREYELAAGRNLESGDEVLLDAAFAEGLGLQAGDTVRLMMGGIQRREMTVVGLLRPRTGAAVGRGSVLFMPLRTVQARLRVPGRVNRIQVALEEGADEETVRAAIAQELPEGLTVRSAGGGSQMGEETMRSLQNALYMAQGFALLAAFFIVLNAFLMNVTQRHRQLAVMRAIGATRGQIWRLIVTEAVLTALVGTAAGLAAGWGGALLLSNAMGQLYRTDLPALQLSLEVVALAVVFGVGVSVLGAVVPAWKATKVDPVEGMHEVSRADVEGAPWWFIALGVVGSLVFGGLLAANLLGYLPRYDYVLGAVIFLVCLVFLIPLILSPAARVVSWLLRPFGRPEARIARQQLLRRRVRTALTIGVLFIASSTGLGLASTVMDNINDVQAWYRRVMAGDFFLRALTPDLANWELVQVPQEVEEEVRAVPNTDLVFGVRFVTGEVLTPGGEPLEVMITAREFPTVASITKEAFGLSRKEVLERLHEGQVTIGSVLAQRLGLQPGDTVTLQTADGPKPLRIAAIVNDYMAGGLVIHMERSYAQELLNVQGVDAFVIRAEEGRKEQVEADLRAIAEKHGLLLQSYAELTAEIDQMMAGVIGGLWVVLILGLVVASLGVMNTLSMNVLEQTRELAMLRVVAMTRNQARKTVLAQAAILGSIGLAPGVLVGVGFSWLINRSLMATIGREVEFGFHPWLAVWGLIVALLLVVLTSWLPAQRAANLEPIQALRYE